MGKRANGEGSVYQRKQGQWVAAVSLGTGKRKYIYCRSQAEAVYALQYAQQSRLLGTLTSTRNETLETFLLKWLQYEIQPKVRERTYQTYQQIVRRHLLPVLGQIALQKLTSWDIQDLYEQKRREQIAASTIAKIHRMLSHALKDAVKLGHVLRNVSEFVELPAIKKQERVTQALTFEQARTLLAVAKDDPLEALYVLALTTGLRQGELLALKWSDLDLTYGKLQVQRALIRVKKGKAIIDTPKSPTSRRCIRLPQLAMRRSPAISAGNISPTRKEPAQKEHQNGFFVTSKEFRCKQHGWFASPFSHSWPKQVCPLYDFMICDTRRRPYCSLSASIRKLCRNYLAIARSL